jgi:hypothetical protein
MFPKIRESLEIDHLIADDDGICAKIMSTFAAIEDTVELRGSHAVQHSDMDAR